MPSVAGTFGNLMIIASNFYGKAIYSWMLDLFKQYSVASGDMLPTFLDLQETPLHAHQFGKHTAITIIHSPACTSGHLSDDRHK